MSDFYLDEEEDDYINNLINSLQKKYGENNQNWKLKIALIDK